MLLHSVQLTLLIVLLEILIDTPYEIHKQAPSVLTHRLSLLPLKLDPSLEVVWCKLRWLGCGCGVSEGIGRNSGKGGWTGCECWRDVEVP